MSDKQQKGLSMFDDQMGLRHPIRRETDAWLAWADSELMQSKVREFLETLRESYDGEWWKAPRLVGILEKARNLFGDLEGFRNPENRDKADQLVRFIAQCYVHRGMEWMNRPEWGEGIYTDFGPAVRGADNDVRGVTLMTEDLFEPKGPERVARNMNDARPVSRT